MHHHMGHILAAILAGGLALLLSRCGLLPTSVEASDLEVAESMFVATTTSTEAPTTTTTTTTIPRSTTTVGVAPVLETDDPDEIAYCFATALVHDVLATGVRGEINRVRSAIERRTAMMRAVTPPAAIAADLDTTLSTAEQIGALLADTSRDLDETHDELALLLSDDEFRSSSARIADFERDVCLLD